MLDLKLLTQSVGDLEEEVVMEMLNEFVSSIQLNRKLRKQLRLVRPGWQLLANCSKKGNSL